MVGNAPFVGVVVAWFIVCIVVFLIARALVLWYFRINEICDHLKVQNYLLSKQMGIAVPFVDGGRVIDESLLKTVG